MGLRSILRWVKTHLGRKPAEDGYTLYSIGRFTEAEPLLAQAVKRDIIPKNATMFLGAVRSRITRDRRYVDESAMKVRGNIPEELLYMLYGTSLWDIGFKADGADKMRQGVNLSPTLENLWCIAGRFENDFDTGSLYKKEASEYLRIIMNMDHDNDADSLIDRGGWLRRQGKYAEAALDLEKAVSLLPIDAAARFELAGLLATQGHFDKALPEYAKSVELKYYELHEAWAGVGYCLFNLGRLKGARKATLRSLKISPDYDYSKEMLREIECAIYWMGDSA